MRTCTACKLEKEESDFYFSKTHNRLDYYCKACHRNIVREYAKTDKGRTATKRRSAKMLSLYRNKDKARRKLRYEVRMGRIVKPSACDSCNNELKVEAHHEDYDKPLDVNWYCNPCHKSKHGKLTDFSLIGKSEEG